MKFLEKPNLPTGKVKVCVVSESALDLIAFLKNNGMTVITTSADSRLPTPVNNHPDMQLHHLGDRHFIILPNSMELKNAFTILEGHVLELDSSPAQTYPKDCILNACVLDHRVFMRPTMYNEMVIEEHKSRKRVLEKVHQGYAKCSTAVVAENAIITADMGIASCAEKSGVEVLRISPGYISLPGYNYGFIGGCCGLIDSNLMLFYGDLSTHPQWREVLAFLKKHCVQAHCFGEGNLRDIGSIIPISE